VAPGRLGVLLLHMGGPRSLDEVRPFLRRLFSDPAMIHLPAPARLPLAWLIATSRAPSARRRYALMGGASPAVAQVTALAAAVEHELAAAGADAAVEPAFLYCGQDAGEAIDRLRARGAARWSAVPEYPQWSGTTTGASWRALDVAAAARAAAAPGLARIGRARSWCDDPGFADAWADVIGRTLRERFPAGARPHLLFSAHGLPQSHARLGDPYPDQILRSVAAVAARFPDLPHGLAFQSRVGPVKWIGPEVTAEVRRLAAAGTRELLIVPISFLTDHVETLVELDVELAAVARAAGVTRFERPPPAATSPHAIRALALAALAAAGEKEGTWRSS
jgi:ferrochelatase